MPLGGVTFPHPLWKARKEQETGYLPRYSQCSPIIGGHGLGHQAADVLPPGHRLPHLGGADGQIGDVLQKHRALNLPVYSRPSPRRRPSGLRGVVHTGAKAKMVSGRYQRSRVREHVLPHQQVELVLREREESSSKVSAV